MPFDICERCGWLGVVSEHHKIPVSEGGTDGSENIELLCPNCHTDEHCTCIYQLETFGETKETWDEAKKHHRVRWCHKVLEICLSSDEQGTTRMAFLVYLWLKANTITHEGIVGATIDEITDGLGSSRPTISKAMQYLVSVNLIRNVYATELRRRGTLG